MFENSLNLSNLNTMKEKVLFIILLFLSLIFWATPLFLAYYFKGFASVLTILGFGLGVVFFIWLSNGLFIADLKSSAVQISKNQVSELNDLFLNLCEKFNLKKMPKLYVVESGGLLNAFATKHCGRDFVVLYSNIIEAYGYNSEEIKFVLGHEIGHIKSNHIFKHILLLPASILPLIGNAYFRACESSCDRYGYFATNDVNASIKAIMILSGGKVIGKNMDADDFAYQYTYDRGFFVSWAELISGYPTLSQRVYNLVCLKNNKESVNPGRNFLAYIFAFFSFGGRFASSGNILVSIAIYSIILSILLPALTRARSRANMKLCEQNIKILYSACEKYQNDYQGNYPDQLSKLYPDYVSNLEHFVCPGTDYKINNPESVDELNFVGYSYISGLKRNDPKRMALILDYSDNHLEYGNVCLLDGSISPYTKEDLILMSNKPWSDQYFDIESEEAFNDLFDRLLVIAPE